MPVFTTPEDRRFPWYVRLFFWSQKRRDGAVLEPARLWGRTSKVFIALALLYGAWDRRSPPVEPSLRSMIMVRVVTYELVRVLHGYQRGHYAQTGR